MSTTRPDTRAFPQTHLSARALAALAALGIAALTLLAYRDLPPRPFAADDYQWLLGARSLSFGEMLRSAFDPSQSHFYRPLVWVLFWAQAQLFGLSPQGFHAVSLGLHLLNAALAGLLGWRLTSAEQPPTGYVAILAMAFVALHPAPFEAVVWVSAQSDLLASALLLAMLNVWVGGGHAPGLGRAAGATLLLVLALLAKESAVIGLVLLALFLMWARPSWPRAAVALALPLLATLVYLGLQRGVAGRNYLVENGGYGIGPQILLNPLRSLALLVAPLPGTETAQAQWLPLAGALVAAALLVLLVRSSWRTRALMLALGVTMLPTAPFVAPPNSRYLYLPAILAALLLAWLVSRLPVGWAKSAHGRWIAVAVVMIALLGAAELSARETRFATASGPDGSLWRLSGAICAERTPDRVIVVEPPIAEDHVRAILELSCGDAITPIIVKPEHAEANLEANSVIIDFVEGAARLAQRTP